MEVTDDLEGEVGFEDSEAIEHMELFLEPMEGVEGGVAKQKAPPFSNDASSITCSSSMKSGLVVTLPNLAMISSIWPTSDNMPSSSSITGFKEATKLQYLCRSSVSTLLRHFFSCSCSCLVYITVRILVL